MTTTPNYLKDGEDKLRTAPAYTTALSRLDGSKPAPSGGSTFVEHLKDDAADIVHSAAREAGQRVDKMKSAANGYLKGMEKEVIAKPAQSMAIAFAAGAVFSLLFARR